MRKLLTLSIPLVLGVGLLAAALNDTEEQPMKAAQSGAVTNTTLPAVIEGSPAPAETTTTTVAPAPEPEPEPETTTTTAAPTTTTTRYTAPPATFRPAPTTTTTTAPAPPPSQAAAPSTIDCGAGSAKAVARLVSNGLTAIVTNESTKAIQLDRLVVQAIYDGVERTFSVEVGGRVVESGNEMTFQIPESAGQGTPQSFEISEFRFHTAGLPECSSR